MRRRLLSLALLAGLLALAACAAEETTKEEAKPAAPAPAAPAPAPEAKPAWQEEWERLLAAAKREGKVAVAGPVGADARRSLEGFERKFGIQVEYHGETGATFLERLRSERAAGQYLWDISLGGLTSWVGSLNEGLLDPIEPVLILPEVKDPKSWRLGQLYWLDDQKRLLGMGSGSSSPLAINTNLVKPGDLRSYRDLLDPKWKGKLLSGDPRVAGAQLAHYTFFYMHPQLGADFIRALARQDMILGRNHRQLLEWLAQGRFPILIGVSRNIARPLIREGVPIRIVDPTSLREGAMTSVANGGLVLINRAPHSNAAKLFINWILTKEGAYEYHKSQSIPSLRVDVPADYLEKWELPNPDFIRMDTRESQELRLVVRKLAEEIFSGR